MKNLLEQGSLERLSGVFTWALVAGTSLYFSWHSDTVSGSRFALAMLLYFAFVGLFWLTTADRQLPAEPKLRLGLNGLQMAAVVGIYVCVPYTYNAILMVIVSAQVVHSLPFSLAVRLSPLWSVPLALVNVYHWSSDYGWLSALLFWSFNLFAMMSVRSRLQEAEARQAAEQISRELRATQSLLSEASRQEERTRIARNIHDLLGHHLTALTINLQVAGHHAEGEALEQVQRCHAIAKLLLADVREAVSDLRDGENIDLQQALNNLFENVPSLRVTLSYQPGLKITRLETAEALLRCVQESVTNTLKHGQAGSITVKLRQQDDNIRLEIADDGNGAEGFKRGNGLLGMEERIAALGGRLQVTSLPQGFATRVEVPL